MSKHVRIHVKTLGPDSNLLVERCAKKVGGFRELKVIIIAELREEILWSIQCHHFKCRRLTSLHSQRGRHYHLLGTWQKMWIPIRDISIALKRILEKHLAFRQVVPNTFTKFLWTIYNRIQQVLQLISSNFTRHFLALGSSTLDISTINLELDFFFGTEIN